jgi:hypothetical protein
MNRRTFGLRTIAAVAAAIGLTAASISIGEAADPGFPPDLCVGLTGRARETCVEQACRRETDIPRREGSTIMKRNWEIWGYSNVKACIDENS